RWDSPVQLTMRIPTEAIDFDGVQYDTSSFFEKPRRAMALNTSNPPGARALFCGRDGWCHLTTIIDCYDRTIVDWRRLSRSRVARIGAATLEDALRDRRIAYGHVPLTSRSDQRARVRGEGLRERRPPLRARPGVHHAVLAGAER